MAAPSAKRYRPECPRERLHYDGVLAEGADIQRRIRTIEERHCNAQQAMARQFNRSRAEASEKLQAAMIAKVPDLWYTIFCRTYECLRVLAERTPAATPEGQGELCVRMRFEAPNPAFSDTELWYKWPSRETSGVRWIGPAAPASRTGAQNCFFDLFDPQQRKAQGEEAEAAEAEEEFQLVQWLAQLADQPMQGFLGKLPPGGDTDDEDDAAEPNDTGGGAARPGVLRTGAREWIRPR
eukprot:TRINITY_DN64938_c0_g1_i2.p1 TRINITY_DN64938_c0_g1~~TRINITY_DN64938_c0_g1_i2.p1  ORF type:complete len:261 (+),score=72.51 TRINITY_DN64938_c0_g1_i2:72-785(+)